jgi:uncharacterized membrane-anchored protein YhcB (DUF1043 family)
VESVVINLPVVIVGALLLLAVGLGIGILMGRGMSPGAQKYRETERQLDQVLQDKKAYEDDVVQHFTETARLLNNLTESYREVHNQLAQGASNLCRDQGPVPLGRLENERDRAEIPDDLINIKPPLDYAPKSSPDAKGVLSEEFGVEQEKDGKRPGAERPD